jgi:DNA-binding MarR family transcriptional regulator
MQHLLIKELPKYECFVESAQRYPEMDPSAMAVLLHLLRTGDELFRVISSTFRGFQLSQGRFMVMLHLFNKIEGKSFEMTPAELAERACVTRATITGLLDGLERDAYLVRRPDPKDRRMVLVSLTEQGMALMERVLPAHYALTRELMKPLNEAERLQLVALLERLCESLGNVDSEPSTPES